MSYDVIAFLLDEARWSISRFSASLSVTHTHTHQHIHTHTQRQTRVCANYYYCVRASTFDI